MKLNQDCVRDALLAIEDIGTINNRLSLSDLLNTDFCKKYDINNLGYTVSKLLEAGFINASTINSLGGKGFIIRSITWDGHQFLDNIRDKDIWDKTKSIISKVSSVSLPILSDVAKNVLLQKLGLD
nr:hypothetical protein C3495_06180 [Clostridiaceae bacterium 14S0207]